MSAGLGCAYAPLNSDSRTRRTRRFREGRKREYQKEKEDGINHPPLVFLRVVRDSFAPFAFGSPLPLYAFASPARLLNS
jgi:hypothetical protein